MPTTAEKGSVVMTRSFFSVTLSFPSASSTFVSCSRFFPPSETTAFASKATGGNTATVSAGVSFLGFAVADAVSAVGGVGRAGGVVAAATDTAGFFSVVAGVRAATGAAGLGAAVVGGAVGSGGAGVATGAATGGASVVGGATAAVAGGVLVTGWAVASADVEAACVDAAGVPGCRRNATNASTATPTATTPSRPPAIAKWRRCKTTVAPSVAGFTGCTAGARGGAGGTGGRAALAVPVGGFDGGGGAVIAETGIGCGVAPCIAANAPVCSVAAAPILASRSLRNSSAD